MFSIYIKHLECNWLYSSASVLLAIPCCIHCRHLTAVLCCRTAAAVQLQSHGEPADLRQLQAPGVRPLPDLLPGGAPLRQERLSRRLQGTSSTVSTICSYCWITLEKLCGHSGPKKCPSPNLTAVTRFEEVFKPSYTLKRFRYAFLQVFSNFGNWRVNLISKEDSKNTSRASAKRGGDYFPKMSVFWTLKRCYLEKYFKHHCFDVLCSFNVSIEIKFSIILIWSRQIKWFFALILLRPQNQLCLTWEKWVCNFFIVEDLVMVLTYAAPTPAYKPRIEVISVLLRN